MAKLTCNKENEINKLVVGQIEMHERLKMIEKRLFGNGVKGIIQKLDDATSFMNEHKSNLSKLREALDFMIREEEKSHINRMSRKELLGWCMLIFSILGTALIGLIIWVIKKTIELNIGG